LLGGRNIDLFGVFGGIGEYGDFAGEDFHEAACYHDALLVGTLLNAKLTDLQDRDERSVMRQDADLAVHSGRDYHVNVVVQENLTLGRHYFQCKWH
jgi:hypothetical protein